MLDAAHAWECSHGGRMLASHGRCEVFSFHATKFLNSFGGDAVVTDDRALAEKLRLMRNFGFAVYDKVIYVGTDGKMTEASAALGQTSLDSIDQFVNVNQRNYEAYTKAIGSVAGLTLLAYNPLEHNNYQYVVVEFDAEAYGLTRDELVAVPHAENVRARRYFWPGCHRMEPDRSFFGRAGLLLPNIEWVASRVVLFPTGTSVSPADISAIGNVLRTAASLAPIVRRVSGAATGLPVSTSDEAVTASGDVCHSN